MRPERGGEKKRGVVSESRMTLLTDSVSFYCLHVNTYTDFVFSANLAGRSCGLSLTLKLD